MNTAGGHDPKGFREEKSKRQGELLREREDELSSLAREHRKEEFFSRIMPALGPLRAYIERRIRLAAADGEINTTLFNSSDILDEVVLRAYEKHERKPSGLTLEQWLYRLANTVLDEYIRSARAEKRRVSLEDLRVKELRTLEEPMTADAEGEPWLVEELDDAEYNLPDFVAPSDRHTPEQRLENKEQLRRMVRALASLPPREQIVFDLIAIERFPEDVVAAIVDLPVDEVERIAEKVRRFVLERFNRDRGSRGSEAA